MRICHYDPETGGSAADAWKKAGYGTDRKSAWTNADECADDGFAADIGGVRAEVFHNGYYWIMRFIERGCINRLQLGHGLTELKQLSAAFICALMNFHSPMPLVMVGGVPFSHAEAQNISDFLRHIVGVVPQV